MALPGPLCGQPKIPHSRIVGRSSTEKWTDTNEG